MDHPGKKKPAVSRRELLFGLVNRLRGPEEDGRQLASLSAQEVEGDRLAAAGDLPKATQAYRQVLSLQPQLALVRAKLGRCLYLSGRILQAKVELLRAQRDAAQAAGQAASRQGEGTAALFLGLCHAREANLPRACEAWRGYFNPDRPQVMREINVVVALHEAGQEQDPAAAVAAVEAALGIAGQTSGQAPGQASDTEPA